MRSEHQRRVDEFMRLAGQELPEAPCLPPPEIRKLRAKLILEEAFEIVSGLGLAMFVHVADHGIINIPEDVGVTIDTVEFCEGPPADLIEIIDGGCDLKVVTTGTFSACGVDDELVQRLVDENNLAKFGPGGYRREDGKWIKPPGHKPPDLAAAIGWPR